MKLTLLLFCTLILLLGLISSSHAQPTEASFNNLAVVTVEYIGPLGRPSAVLFASAVQAVSSAFQKLASGGAGFAQFAADAQDLVENNWGTLSFISVTTKTLNASLLPALITGGDLNFSASVAHIMSGDYNATLCASDIYSIPYLPGYSIQRDLITIHDPLNCGQINQTAYFPCTTDADCVDSLVCASSSWAVAAVGPAFAASWCVPASNPTPVEIAHPSFSIVLEDADPEHNLAVVSAEIEANLDNWGCTGAEVSVSTNDTSFAQGSTILVDFSVFNASAACQAGIDSANASVFEYVDETCIENLASVTGILTSTVAALPVSINAESDCGVSYAGFTPCNTTADCANNYQCGAADVVGFPDVLACQLNLQTNFVSFNITIAVNPGSTNSTINYVALTAAIAALEQELESNGCLSIDSAESSYIPQNEPYQTALVLVTHLNTTNDACVSFNSNTFALNPIFNVSVETTQSNVYVADCLTSSGEIISADTCAPTTDATDPVLPCSSDSDCVLKQTCTAVSTSESVCLVSTNGTASHNAMTALVMLVSVLVALVMA